MALENQAPDVTARPGPSRMTDTRRQDFDNMDFQDSAAQNLPAPRGPSDQNAGTGSQSQTDGGWQTVLTLRQKKAIAKEKKTKPPEYSGTLKHQEASAGQATGKSKRKPAYRRLPPLPKDDFKIVVRPHQGLPVKNLTSPLLADAVIVACGGQISGEQFLLRIKPGSNIFIVSTPHQTVADYVRRITTLSINGRPHSVNAYVATSEGTTKGVIHGLDPHTTPEALKANLRIRTQGVEILQARMFRNTKTAVITFFGRITPRYVYYNGGELACYPYKVTTQVCKVCHQMGHRSDVCPQPDTPVCHTCGQQDPVDGHECAPKCAACGEGHMTGDRSCKKRLKPQSNRPPRAGVPRTTRKDPSTKPPQRQRWLSSDDEESASDPFPELPGTRRRSRSRTPKNSNEKNSPTHSQSPKTPKSRAPGTATKQAPQDNTVSWARVVSPTAPVTENPAYQKIINENKLLRESLAEIKRELASLKASSCTEPNKTAHTKEAGSPVKVITTPNTMEGTLQQVVQQLQTMQNFQQQMYAELQSLKTYVDESVASVRTAVRKRASTSPGAQSSRRPKPIPSSDSESTIHGE